MEAAIMEIKQPLHDRQPQAGALFGGLDGE